MSDELRPPSPFEEIEEDETTHINPENYFGGEALARFWKMFQKQDSTSRSKRPRPGSPRFAYYLPTSYIYVICLYV